MAQSRAAHRGAAVEGLAAGPTQADVMPIPALFLAVQAPVVIDACRLYYHPASNVPGTVSLTKKTGLLTIKFTNEADKPATTVRFGVDLNGTEASVRDVGSFAPGVTISHDFKDFLGSTQFIISREEQPKCHVAYVKFADGSTWTPHAGHAAQ